MPISEDEYEQRPNQSTLSKAEQRRNNKPIMEKRRRARINHCLNELKTLILDAMKKDPARHSKLEKADILEMTVKHLQTLQRQQLAVAVATDPSVLQKFKTGFDECATEVNRYIGDIDSVETGVKQRLATHLNTCVSGLQQVNPFSFSNIGVSTNSTIPLISQENSNPSTSTTSSAGFNGDVNNNQNTSRIQIPPGIQLIPSRLPTGELAFLVPNSHNIPFFNSSLNGSQNLSTSEIPQRSSSSAFTSVRPSKHSESIKIQSPPLSPASSTTSFDDHQISESFQRPRTPSPKEVAISFPTPPGSMQSLHHPTAFKPSTVTSSQEQKPAQQFQVTSTSFSPESTKPELGLKIEYKTVPIYQPSEKHRDNYRSFSNKNMEPLSVITTDKPKLVEETIIRKRPYLEDRSSEGLLVVAHDSQPSTSKYARYSLDDTSPSSSSNSSSGNVDQRFAVESYFHQQPSTSGQNSGGSIQQADGHNDQMWRPW